MDSQGRRKVFSEKYANNSWQGTESRSGPGSSLAKNRGLLELLAAFMFSRDLRSLMDCGCGDFNWMKHFDFSVINEYCGSDIVIPEIMENIAKYGSDKIRFIERDIVTDPIEKTFDVILCKDVLFHLSYADALKALDLFKQSKSKYLIATTFPGFINHDIPTGNWHRIDMATAPFNLGTPELLWENIEGLPGNTGQIEKCMGVWVL